MTFLKKIHPGLLTRTYDLKDLKISFNFILQQYFLAGLLSKLEYFRKQYALWQP